MLTLKEDVKKKKFYEAYSKHILLIEITLISTLTFTYACTRAPVSILAFGVLFIATPVSIYIHLRIFNRIVKRELYPYEILRLARFRFYSLIMVWFSLLLSMILFVLLDLFKTENLREILVIVQTLLVDYIFIVNFPMFFITFLLFMGSITEHKKATFSFKIVIDAMELLRKEKKTYEEMKLIDKYVKCFREGLRSYNSYLYESNPACLGIVDVDQYHRSVCSVALMGKGAEIDNTIEQIKSALNCMGEREREDDLRHFLIALKNVKSGKAEKEYPFSELNEMIRAFPFSERLKERLKSPYVTSLVTVIIGMIAIVLQLLRLIWK